MRFLPREEEFFELFIEVARRAHEASGQLKELFALDAERSRHNADVIKRLEHEADQITREVVNRLDRTFITPLDREDIHLLASDLDDVIDRLDGAARRAAIFRVGAPAPHGVAELCDVIERITGVILNAVTNLRKNKDVMEYCVAAKRLEEEGDTLYHESLGHLFEKETDPIQLIKWKDIIDRLEATIDDAEDVAQDLQSIALKNT